MTQPDASPLRVLLVEDEALVAILFEELLPTFTPVKFFAL
jgi:hypothetical protein